MSAVVRKAQHDLRVAALPAVEAHARLAVKLQRVVSHTLEVVLAGRQRPPRAQPPLRLVVVGVERQIVGVELAVLVVAYDGLVAKEHLHGRPLAGKSSVVEARPLMPRLCRDIVDPRRVSGRERQHVEGVAVLLVGVGRGVSDVGVLLDLPLNGVRADAHARVAVGAVDDALAARVSAQPEQGVVELGDRERRSATDLVERALDALERERGRTGIVPDLDRVGAEKPHFGVIHNRRNQAIRVAFGAGEVQRINRRAVQKLRDPHLLAVGFDEDEVSAQIRDGQRAGEVRVGDQPERQRAVVVDVAGATARDEELDAVVGH